MGTLDLQAIGQRIRTERERLELTREQFAEAIDVSPLYIGQIERGQRMMSLKTFVKVVVSLHADAGYLLLGDSKQPDDAEKSGIYAMLEKCSVRELKFAEDVLKLFLTYVK